MISVSVWIACAFLFGFLAQRVGMPPLIGYLMTGFGLTFAGSQFGWATSHHGLDEIAHAGVLILLFTVGLKLKFSQVVKKEVFGTSIIHMLISAVVYAIALYLAFGWDIETVLLLGCALSFSSTVLVASVLEDKDELRAFHGRMAIAILIVQDLGAMALISVTSGEVPHIASFGILFLFAFRPVFHKMLDWCGHGGMLILLGLALAFIGGEVLFHHVLGLSAELGALLMGAMCAKHSKASELYNSLWSLKEVFLIGFFLTIGLNGLPTQDDFLFALFVVALLPVQGAIFFALLVAFKLKARTAFLSAVALTNFSEFGLIVSAKVMPEWTVPLALAVTLSFVISAPLNKYAHPLFSKFEKWLSRFERSCRHPDEVPMTLGETKILIVGLGQIGRAAFREASIKYGRELVLGVDSDAEKVNRLKKKERYNVEYADAEHSNFWGSLNTEKLDAVILACEYDAAIITLKSLRAGGFSGTIVAHSKYEDQAKRLEDAGATHSHMTLHEAGKGLLSHIEA